MPGDEAPAACHSGRAASLRARPGLPTWQGQSRYDAVLAADGHLRVIELNSGCAGSLVNAAPTERVVRTALAEPAQVCRSPARRRARGVPGADAPA